MKQDESGDGVSARVFDEDGTEDESDSPRQEYERSPRRHLAVVSDHDGEMPFRHRARTQSIKRLSKRDLEHGRAMYPEAITGKPGTREECLNSEGAERPCPYVSCKHHLYLDINERTGAIKMNFPDLEVEELPESCSLDIADRGGITLEEVGEMLNLTRERIRQLETVAIAKIKALNEASSLSDYITD